MGREYLLFILLILSQVVWSNNYLPVEKYNINDGLSHSEITSLHVDNKGFLWIGTTDGLNRYDGYNFRRFNTDPKDSSSISSDYIFDIEEDKIGNIWCATITGVSKYDKAQNSFTFYTASNNNTAGNNSFSHILDIAVDKNGGQVYMLGENFIDRIDISDNRIYQVLCEKDLNRVNQHEFSSVAFISQSSTLVINISEGILLLDPMNNSVRSILDSLKTSFIEDGGIQKILGGYNDDFVFYTKHHIWHYNLKNESISRINYSIKQGEQLSIMAIEFSSPNHLQIIVSSGIIDFDLEKNKILNFVGIDFNSKQKLSISSFLKDNCGVLWFGTNSGLFKFNPYKNVFKTFYLTDYFNSTETDYIIAASFDKSGLIWTGFNSGKMFLINPEAKNIKNAIVSVRNLNCKLNAFTSNSKGDIFISTNNGLYIFRNRFDSEKTFQSKIEPTFFSSQEVFITVIDENDSAWTATLKGIYSVDFDKKIVSEFPRLSELLSGEPVIGIQSTSYFLWIVQEQRIIELDKQKSLTQIISFSQSAINGNPLINSTLIYNDKKLLIGTSDGLFIYSALDKSIDLFVLSTELVNNHIHAMIADNSGKLWISTNSGITSFDQKNSKTRHLDANDGLLDQVFSDRLVSQSFSGLQLFGGNRFIVAFQPDSIAIDNSIPKVEFVEVVLSGKNDNKIKNIAEHDTLEIEPKYHYIKISFSLLDFWAPFKNRYKYSIEKIGSQARWIYLDGQNYLILSGLKAGYYKLCIRGSNNENTWNENSSDLVIHVIAPFWQSRIAFLMYGIVTIIIFYFTIFFRTKHLLKLNREHRQKEQIAKKVEQQKEELSFKNKNITDSIYYAKRIQEALMPSHKLFRKFFPDSFILHIPKDIVSGDFYWINEVDNRVYFAAVDCTGHGVPGAFMSIIGFELFRRITETEKKRQPAEILNGLSHGFKTFFRDVENYTVRDGMDVAFCAIDKERKYLEYAGAFNPLYLARDNTITEIKGDRFSVGLYDDAEVEQNKYKNHLIPLIDGDIIYIFTDGFADQFGGPEGKKYKYRRFRLLLLALLQLPMERQFEFLRKSINDWKGELDQVDDILIMGIRISHEK